MDNRFKFFQRLVATPYLLALLGLLLPLFNVSCAERVIAEPTFYEIANGLDLEQTLKEPALGYVKKMETGNPKAIDKFKERGLTPVPGNTVKAPLVGECPVALECRVKEALELGSHWLFIAEILAVRVDPGLVDGNGKLDMEKAGLITYAHGNYYAVGEELGRFGFSVRKKQ